MSIALRLLAFLNAAFSVFWEFTGDMQKAIWSILLAIFLWIVANSAKEEEA